MSQGPDASYVTTLGSERLAERSSRRQEGTGSVAITGRCSSLRRVRPRYSGVTRPHRRTALVLVISMLLAIGGSQPAIASGAGEANSEPGSVAAATLPEVVMVCRSNQTDINHATASALQAALGVGAPTAHRVVAFRPYLAPKDLLVVEGIGPDRLASILRADNTCATPTQLPPPSAEACTTATPVDLASAPAAEVSQRLDINLTAARRIVAARPFAVLAHVTPERVPGVGKGTLDRVVAASCLTPSPVRTAEVSYRWAYRSQTTTVSRDGFALTVPAGVLDQSGAWLSVEPIDNTVTSADGSLPTGDWPLADFHVHGQWANGDKVSVMLPQDPLLEDVPDWVPYIIHHRTDGEPEVLEGAAVTRSGSSVSAEVDSLSIVESLARASSWTSEVLSGALFGNKFPAPTCAAGWSQRSGTRVYESTEDAELTLDSSVLDLPGNISASGYPMKHCLEPEPLTTTARIVLRNNTGGIMEMRPLGGDVELGRPTDNDLILKDRFGFMITEGWHLIHPDREYFTPGAQGWFESPRASFRAVDSRPDRVSSALYIALRDGLDLLKASQSGAYRPGEAIVDLLQSAVDCVLENLDSSSQSSADQIASLPSRLAACIPAENLIRLIRTDLSDQFRNGQLPGNVFHDHSVALQKIDRWLKWLTIGGIVVKAADTAFWSTYVPNGIVSAEHWAPRPTIDGQGRRIVPGCLDPGLYEWVIDEQCQGGHYARISTPPPGSGGGQTGRNQALIARDELGNAWLVDYDDLTGGRPTARHIEDPSTYLCLARHYAVDWDARLGDYIGTGGPAVFDSSRDATCDWSQPATRRLDPTDPDWRSAVLRQPNGTAWIAHTDGGRQHIDSTAWFADLVTNKDVHYADGEPPRNAWSEQFVWDQVTDQELARFAVIVVAPF